MSWRNVGLLLLLLAMSAAAILFCGWIWQNNIRLPIF